MIFVKYYGKGIKNVYLSRQDQDHMIKFGLFRLQFHHRAEYLTALNAPIAVKLIPPLAFKEIAMDLTRHQLE